MEDKTSHKSVSLMS